MKIVFFVGIVLFLSACSTQPKKPVWIAQNPEIYSHYIDAPPLSISQEQYEKQYFSAWNLQTLAQEKRDILWPFRSYNPNNSYGENLQKREQSFFDAMRKNINLQEYATYNKKALTLRSLNLRALPSEKPLFLDPKRAGEGFPFDYLQNSSIAANKPVLITHYSKDREWVHIISSFTYGWVKSNDVVILNNAQVQEWQQREHLFSIKDQTSIYSPQGFFLYKARLGMLLPFVGEESHSYIVLVAKKGKDNQAVFLNVKVSKEHFHKGVLAFNQKNRDTILTQLEQSKYGWGGMFHQRDCSSTMRDFFAPFGVWLPRNSSQQSKVGRVISLQGLSDREKLDVIREKAVAYRTLLYKKGHIVLYVGIHNNTIIVFQNMWGIKTKKSGKEGRYIVGKALFSTLEFGKNLENYDENSSLLHTLESINILF